MRPLLSFAMIAIPAWAEQPQPATWKLYGQLELDGTRDSNATSLGGRTGGNSLWDLAAQPSLLGLRFAAQGPGESRISGRLEADFNGSAGTSSSPQPRMRHAFVEVAWPSGFSILAGHTDDIAAPLLMDTISYPLESLTGDLGHRRPQLRATQTLRLGDQVLAFQVAASTREADLDQPVESGATRVSIPIGLARVAFTAHSGAWPRATLGIYGHTGSARFTFQGAGDSQQVRSWSGGLDLKAEFTPAWTLMGELWRGVTLDLTQRNQNALLSLQRRQGIHAQGGWASLTWQPRPDLRANLGTGRQRMLAEDVPPGQAQHITTSFANLFYDPVPALEVGLEVSYWQAQAFQSLPAQDKTRMQFTFVYKF